MRSEAIPPYNPLDKKNLGKSVADALLEQPIIKLPPPKSFVGAGIYAIYYVGDFPEYFPIAHKNSNNKFLLPIYVGKAIPAGARKGNLGLDMSPGTVLYKRLYEHSKSIEQSNNLNIKDFFCRYLVVDDIWIPLGESLMIDIFPPLWNKIVDGFGNHDPGSGRYNQQSSPWDVLHPGRPWVSKLTEFKKTKDDILREIKDYLNP